MGMMTGLFLLLIGLIAGGYGTIVGAGGGFIFVPALLIVLQVEPAIAASSGLVIVLINSLSGVVGYAKQKKINYQIGVRIGISAIPGSFIGVWLVQLGGGDSRYFYWIFASVLVILGIFLFMKNTKNAEREQQESRVSETPNQSSITLWKLIPLGLILGVMSSYLGIGGGWMLVPILIYFFRTPTHQATATSIFTLCIYTSAGVLSQLLYGSIDWMIVAWGGLGVIAGAQLGVYLSTKIPSKVVIQMLSILLIIIGIRTLFA